jgi:Holliday junction resolvasome RuvABC ATP-dependent DNA helicase subunit
MTSKVLAMGVMAAVLAISGVVQGANRLNVIASTLGLPARTLAVVTEPFLIRAGLVVKDDDGRRQLTPKGRSHLSKLCPTSVELPSK